METKVLDHVLQPDAYTCQSAAICRVIGSTKVATVRETLESMGVPGDPAIMGEYLKPRVREYKFNGAASLNDAIAALNAGYQLITHGWFTGSGHVIGLSGWDEKSQNFIAEDPWYEFDFPSWRYDYQSEGDDKPYSALGIYAACIEGTGPDHAFEIYQRGAIDWDLGAMWLHMIKN